jgi:hypothetical protein
LLSNDAQSQLKTQAIGATALNQPSILPQCLGQVFVNAALRFERFRAELSITSAELSTCCIRALRLDPAVHDILPHYMLMIDKVRERADELDVLHFHIDLFTFRFSAHWEPEL